MMRQFLILLMTLFTLGLPATSNAGGVSGYGLPGPAADLGLANNRDLTAAAAAAGVTLPSGGISGEQATVPATPTVPASASRSLSPLTQQTFDYSINLQSEVFGAHLFTGSFARQGATRFNPDYLVQIGDTVIVRLWGAYSFDQPLGVDPKGNIFVPNVGPVPVLGVRNQDIQQHVESAVRSVYRNNVHVYASLDAARPVRVFVGGYVHRPGLYDGTSMDSLLHYLDMAGGIDADRGSFLDVQVKRGELVRARVSLYDFLLKGIMPQIQLADGDVIYVAPRNNTVLVSGLANNAKRFEFTGETITVGEIINLASPKATATHVRVIRNTGTVRNTEYYPLAEAAAVRVNSGDELQFNADKRPGTITVRVEGEHESPQEYVLPYGARLGDLMENINYYPSADKDNIQLFRLSVQERQKQLLNNALDSLETSVLTARSATNEESRLRKDEAELMLQWVEKARDIEPEGQVIIAQDQRRNDLLLENGDIIRIPKQDGLVLVSGEVLFPNAIAYESDLSVEDYIKRVGGYTQSADTSRIVVAHRDGSYEEDDANQGINLFGRNKEAGIKPGDEILVLPKVQTKSIEVTRGITQILFQIAVAARVALDI